MSERLAVKCCRIYVVAYRRTSRVHVVLETGIFLVFYPGLF